jgi:hypothetical protein
MLLSAASRVSSNFDGNWQMSLGAINPDLGILYVTQSISRDGNLGTTVTGGWVFNGSSVSFTGKVTGNRMTLTATFKPPHGAKLVYAFDVTLTDATHFQGTVKHAGVTSNLTGARLP